MSSIRTALGRILGQPAAHHGQMPGFEGRAAPGSPPPGMNGAAGLLGLVRGRPQLGHRFFGRYQYGQSSIPNHGPVTSPIQTDYRFALVPCLIPSRNVSEILDQRGLVAKPFGPMREHTTAAVTVLRHFANFTAEPQQYPEWGVRGHDYSEAILSVQVEAPFGVTGPVYHPLTRVMVTTIESYMVGEALDVHKQLRRIQFKESRHQVRAVIMNGQNREALRLEWRGKVQVPLRLPRRQTFINVTRATLDTDYPEHRLIRYESAGLGTHVAPLVQHGPLANGALVFADPEWRELFRDAIPMGLIHGRSQSVFGENLELIP